MTDNTKTSDLLDDWYDEPDSMGAEFWQEYERELEENPFRI